MDRQQPPIVTDDEIKGTFLDFNLEDWEAEGQELARTKEQDQWLIGDWLIRGEVHGRMEQEALRKHATKATGLTWGTLRNLMWISRTFELSRRNDNLPYSHYVTIAPYDEETQDMLLKKAARGNTQRKTPQPWSVAELRTAIKRLQEQGIIPKTTKKPKAENTAGADADQKVVIQGKVSRKIHDFLKELAAARGVQTPEILIWKMAVAYVEENKPKLQAEVDAYNAKRGAEFVAATLRDAPMEEQLDDEFDRWFAQEQEKSE